MKPVEIKKDIFWVGAVDWNSRDFHGYELLPANLVDAAVKAHAQH